MLQGGLRSFELMEEVIKGNEVDLVSMCRPYIREAGLVHRWMKGDYRKSEWISCNQCILHAFKSNTRITCVLPNEIHRTALCEH